MSRVVDVQGMLDALGIEYKERHGEFWACCPNHKERSPSWSINAETGRHLCFGCKWKGGAPSVVTRVIGFSSDYWSRRWLEERGLYSDAAIPLSVARCAVVSHVAASMAWPSSVPERRFIEWPTAAQRYVASRGLTLSQIKRWRLSYATDGYFASRIVIPTFDRDSNLLNMTGRTWVPNRKPKYKAATRDMGADPESIFGEQYWSALPTRDTVVVCEGELNALACERVGATYVAALGGSQLLKGQVMKLSRFGSIVLAVDIDKAGTEIADQLRATFQRWRRVRVVEFPDARDPSDLALEDPELLTSLLGSV